MPFIKAIAQNLFEGDFHRIKSKFHFHFRYDDSDALKLVGKKLDEVKIVTSGAGAAGIAIIKLLMSMGLKNVIMTDRKGAIYEGREGLNPIKEEMAKITNFNKEKGTLAEVIKGADIVYSLFISQIKYNSSRH